MKDLHPKAARAEILGLDREPWVHIPDAADLAGWSAEDEVGYNHNNRHSERFLMFRRVFDYLNENEVRGDYHEFGCHRCRTFRMALTEARRHNLGDMKFWAFDSFAGLPELEQKVSVSKWRRGSLVTPEATFLQLVQEHGIYLDRVHTVKGLYADSLDAQRQLRFEQSEAKIALVTIDCDLYESAVPVFDFIDPLLQEGSAVYIDDLFVGNRGVPGRGVARAFLEYQRRSRWKFVRHLDVGWWGRVYIAYDPADAIDGEL